MSYDIVVVDDDKLMLKLIEHKLQKTAFIFHCFDNEIQALEYLQCNKTKVLIVDQIMPELNGIDLIQKLRESAPECADKIYLYSSVPLPDAVSELAQNYDATPLTKDEVMDIECFSDLFLILKAS